jgi:hypothetical protein
MSICPSNFGTLQFRIKIELLKCFRASSIDGFFQYRQIEMSAGWLYKEGKRVIIKENDAAETLDVKKLQRVNVIPD